MPSRVAFRPVFATYYYQMNTCENSNRRYRWKNRLQKELKHLYMPSANKVEIVKVPQMNFLMIDGKGDKGQYKIV